MSCRVHFRLWKARAGAGDKLHPVLKVNSAIHWHPASVYNFTFEVPSWTIQSVPAVLLHPVIFLTCKLEGKRSSSPVILLCSTRGGQIAVCVSHSGKISFAQLPCLFIHSYFCYSTDYFIQGFIFFIFSFQPTPHCAQRFYCVFASISINISFAASVLTKGWTHTSVYVEIVL